MNAHSILSRVLGAPEEINGRHRCPTYLYRWFVMRTRWFKAYIHHFVADDWSLDLHDHPKRFISIGLKGSYIEYTPDCSIIGLGEKVAIFNAPWVRSFPAEHVHRVRMVRSGGSNGTPEKLHGCWTFVIVLRGTREWGFWHLGRFIHWRTYVDGAEGIADKMKACGDI